MCSPALAISSIKESLQAPLNSYLECFILYLDVPQFTFPDTASCSYLFACHRFCRLSFIFHKIGKWCLMSRSSFCLFKGHFKQQRLSYLKSRCTPLCKQLPWHAGIVPWFLSCIFQLLCYKLSPPSPSHVRMLMFLPALNLKLSVAPSAPIIANYLLQPQALCWLASSNQTLLFSRQGCVAHQKKLPFNSLNFPSCHCIWVKVTAPCEAWEGKMFRCRQVSVVKRLA